MLMGPVRRNAYSSPMAKRPQKLPATDIQRAHATHLEHRPDLQVILQIRAHATKIVQHLDAVIAQQ